MKKIILFFTFFCCGCSQSLFVISDIEELNTVVIPKLEEQGYVITKNSSNLITTDWKTKYSPYYKNGKREKVNISVTKADLKFHLKITVLYELNYSVQDSLSEQQALWVPSGRNYSQEKYLLALIKQKYLLKK